MAASPTPRTADPDGVAVAFSGGVDSTALLWVTARQGAALGLRVVALHVHHGLQTEADAWEQQARGVCAQLQLPLFVARLSGAPAPGESVEAWARRQRYGALAGLARQARTSLVLLAHHAEDQAETVLLQALRGGGPAGLAAMPQTWSAHGLQWARPWLRRPRSQLLLLAQRSGLPTVQDPSNADPRFARSRLRTQVWPALAHAFPQAATVLGEVAQHAAQARALAMEVAAADLPACSDDAGRLSHAAWSALPPARRRNVLEAWLAARLGQGAPVSLVARLGMQWQGQGRRWPAPGGWMVSRKGWLVFELSPSTK